MSDIITLGGVLVTLISMIVSIYQARSAYKSSLATKNAMQSVQLSAITARLKSAQEHIRDVAPDKVTQRGFKIGDRIGLIRREFDDALSALPTKGDLSAARSHLAMAQESLNSYNSSLLSTPDSGVWQGLQVSVQNAISEMTTAVTELGDMS